MKSIEEILIKWLKSVGRKRDSSTYFFNDENMVLFGKFLFTN